MGSLKQAVLLWRATSLILTFLVVPDTVKQVDDQQLAKLLSQINIDKEQFGHP
tara:strand:- start:6675 stop:6833 length:159 start_codon:yes stop_codon:yes gene_type:complete